MTIPLGRERLKEMLSIYRDAWRGAGHPGNGRVMIAFNMFCHEDESQALRIANEPLNYYFQRIAGAASGWKEGASTTDYPNYDKMIAQLANQTLEIQIESGAAWVGSPEKLVDQIAEFFDDVGGFESASMQVNFGTVNCAAAERSLRLFSEKVILRFDP